MKYYCHPDRSGGIPFLRINKGIPRLSASWRIARNDRIINMIKKVNLKVLISVISLILFYFFTRLFHLTIIPVFADEAIYIRWAQVMRAVASLRFIPLSDGKQPFFMWLIIPFLKIFSDPLVAGRMVSVLAGFGTMTGIGLLTDVLFKDKRLSLLAAFLYIITPFCLFFDRMALVDGLLSCLGVWYLVLVVSLINNRRLDIAMGAGIVLGLALLTKSPAIIFVLMLPLTPLVKRDNDITIKRPRELFKLIGFWMIVLAFGYSIYNILRLGPEFHMIAIRNKDYVFSFSEVLTHPFNPLIGHLKDVFGWYWIMVSLLLMISGLLGIVLLLKKNWRTGLFLLLWFLLPIIAQSAVAKVYTARYVLFTVPSFLIFIAVALNEFLQKVKNKVLVISGLVIVFSFPIYQSFLLITNPQKAWLPENERNGYLEMWTSGYGIKESAEYIKEIAKTQKVLVGTEGYFGTLPDGLQIYLEKVPNITIIGVGQPITEISPKLLDGLKDNKVFLLVNDTRLKIKDPRLNLLSKYPKAVDKTGNQENLLFFEIK